ncbi:hypothetical protein HKX41_12370, partial [Salinisphaera sp. USBA-960]|nr:hypothetical protein [Salifodinibacter halophilus]
GGHDAQGDAVDAGQAGVVERGRAQGGRGQRAADGQGQQAESESDAFHGVIPSEWENDEGAARARAGDEAAMGRG